MRLMKIKAFLDMVRNIVYGAREQSEMWLFAKVVFVYVFDITF